MSFMLFAFAGVFYVVQQKTLNMNNKLTDRDIVGITNVVKSEIDMAELVLDGYQRDFFLQDFINGEKYEMNIIDKIELEITYRNKNHYAFFSREVEGQFLKGDNELTKLDNQVFLNCEGEEFSFIENPTYCNDFGDTTTYCEESNIACLLCCETLESGDCCP